MKKLILILFALAWARSAMAQDPNELKPVKHYSTEQGLLDSLVNDIAQDPITGEVWIVNEISVHRVKGDSAKSFVRWTRGGDLLYGQPIGIAFRGQIVFILTNGGISAYDRTSGVWRKGTPLRDLFYGTGGKVSLQEHKSFDISADGLTIWITSGFRSPNSTKEGGLLRVSATDLGDYKVYTRTLGNFPARRAIDVLVDDERDRVWVSTDSSGILILDTRTQEWSAIGSEQGLVATDFSSLEWSQNRQYILATGYKNPGAGLYVIDPANGSVVASYLETSSGKPIPGPGSFSPVEDLNGNYFIGVADDQGLFIPLRSAEVARYFHRATNTWYLLSDSLTWERPVQWRGKHSWGGVTSILVDDRNQKWFGTVSDGVWVFADVNTTAPTAPEGLAVVDTGAVSARVEWPAYSPGVPLAHLALVMNGDTVATFADTSAGRYTVYGLQPDSEVRLELVAIGTNGLASQPAIVTAHTLPLLEAVLQPDGIWLAGMGDSLTFVARSLVVDIDTSVTLLGVTLEFVLEGTTRTEVMQATVPAPQAGITVASATRTLEFPIATTRAQRVGVQTDPQVDRIGIGYSDQQRYVPLPTEFALVRNYPNPFREQTTIVVDIPRAEGDDPFSAQRTPRQVEVRMYNVLGQEVRHIVLDVTPGSNTTLTLDARDAAGRPLASGVYFYQLRIGEWRSPVGKLLRLK